MSLDGFFKSCPDLVELESTNLSVRWSHTGTGFGGFYFYKDADDKLHCASELMSRDFVKARLNDLVDSAIWDETHDGKPAPPILF